MYIYLAGGAGQNLQICKEFGIQHKLFSFFYDKEIAAKMQWSSERWLWDSGGFTARKKNIFISVEEYADFINKHSIRFAFNLDTNDLQETWRNQNYLEQKTASYIIPIYHYQSWLAGDIQWLDLIKRYPYISVGGLVGQTNRKSVDAFFRFIYSHTGLKKIHFLGKTAEPILKKFPAYTSDSSNWVMGQKYLNILTDRHHSNLTRFRKETLDPYQRIRIDMGIYKELEMKVTSIWCHRGIHFGCPHDEQDFIARKDGHELARSLIRKA